jgi:Na+/melibiose symporter-like transporter
MLGGIGIGLANPAASNAALDLAPRKTAALTGIRTMFSLTGGALSIAGIVLVLSYSPDAARGLELIFQALAGLLLVALALVFFIPDRVRLGGRFVPANVRPMVRPIRIVGVLQHRAA